MRNSTTLVGMGALLALAALCPISRANDVSSAGPYSIGVTVQELTDDLRERLNSRAGVLVTSVAPRSRAELAGIQRGDVLVVVGSVSLRVPEDLVRAESRIEAGQPISVVVARDGGRLIRMMNLEPFGSIVLPAEEAGEDEGEIEDMIRSEALDEPRPAPATRGVREPSPAPAVSPAAPLELLGVRGEDLSPDLAVALGMPRGHGFVVLQVVERTPAALSGIRAGDVIAAVGETRIWGAEHLANALAAGSGPQSLLLRRRGGERRVEVLLSGAPEEPSLDAAHDAQAETASARELRELRREIDILRQELLRLRRQLAESL